jgi:hypothetical protein
MTFEASEKLSDCPSGGPYRRIKEEDIKAYRETLKPKIQHRQITI